MTIEQMVPPKLLKTNMAPDQVPLKVIEVYQTTSIDLYCEVDGRPKPSIVWKKNNVPLNLTGQSGIEFNRNSQHLSIKRLVNDDSKLSQKLLKICPEVLNSFKLRLSIGFLPQVASMSAKCPTRAVF